MGFDEFWEAYPRKVSKAAALKAWRKVKPDELPAIMAALVAQKRSEDWIKDRGRYIPHPATWLNNRRWEDESTPADEIERLAEELRAHPGNPYAAAYHADLVTPEQTADFKTKRERYNKLTEATR